MSITIRLTEGFCVLKYAKGDNMSRLIAVVEDESDIANLVELHLKKANFRVKKFADGSSFLQFLEYETPALVILDLMLPDMDGIEICKFIRGNKRYSTIPIIMLTARSEEADRVLGLEIGADDYIVKPFSPRELVARVKAVLRRAEKQETPEILNIGDVVKIDLSRHKVWVYKKEIELTPTEFKILSLLAERKGWVFSRRQILQYLWGNDKIVLERTVDVHIKHLREKLGEAGRFIKNVRGVGYKLEP